MIKLCWKKDADGKTQEYFFDEKKEKVYVMCLEHYYAKSKLKLTMRRACLIGPVVTFTGAIFDNKNVTLNYWIIILSILILVLGAWGISKGFEISENKKYSYIKMHTVGKELSYSEILELFIAGKKERYGMLGLILLCGFMILISVAMYQEEKNMTSVIMFCLGFYANVIWMKMLAPVKKYNMLRKIKKKL